MVGDRVAKVLIEQGGEFNHGYTYSGHPVACAVALANLDVMAKEGLVERVRDDTGPYLAEVFAKLGEHPLVGKAETCGMVGGLLLLKNKATGETFGDGIDVGMMCRTHCFDNGLIMRAVGNRMIVSPPLTMDRADIDELAKRIKLVLDKTLAQLQSAGQM